VPCLLRGEGAGRLDWGHDPSLSGGSPRRAFFSAVFTVSPAEVSLFSHQPDAGTERERV
jgi:hypothetical protein